ncbi:carbohydrate kinase family protein [Litchfieldia alkalitelluris]|uniref:carbohydrate kinase family protein n=1 Tax=Litchfieldia alkalitelluris TaxID=304268 RepID=UPI001474E8F7|nr:carbohydrate kinase [Litchfieldia alkalitelluris]
MNKQGIISFGEPFIDLYSENQTNSTYHKFLGGATVNVAVRASRFGLPTYYICKIGNDENSTFVKNELKNENVDIEFSVKNSIKKICCVYVNQNDKGDRYFHSYINETPDEWLTADELSIQPFTNAKIFYFGSGTLFHETARKATDKALDYAKECNNLIAFDTNIRLQRWESEEICRETVIFFVKKANLVKIAEDELLFLTNTQSVEDGIRIASEWKVPYLVITLGGEGAYGIHNHKLIYVPGTNVKVVDTTGAGDAFLAALLYCFHEKGLPNSDKQFKDFLQFANEKGALATTKLGSL